jgi:hypothetical protein
MGQAALCDRDLYGCEPLLDKQGLRHAAVKYSTVLLKAGRNQLLSLAESAQSGNSGITCILFSRFGQQLPDAFEFYRRKVSESMTLELEPVGVLVSGEAEKVREISRKFSLLD